MTMEGLAELLGFSSTGQISLWENNNRMPEPERIRQLARVLNTSVDWLLSGDGNKPEPGYPQHPGNLVVREIENGSRGVLNDPAPHRYDWTRVVTLDRVRSYLRAFGDELHALGASPDEEDEAVRSVRNAGGLAYNAERVDWTEDEAIQLMEIPAESLRRYFTGLKRRRAPDQ